MNMNPPDPGETPFAPPGRILAEGILALGLCVSEQTLLQTLMNRAASLLPGAHWVVGRLMGEGDALEVIAASSALRLRMGETLIGQQLPAFNSPFTRALVEAHLPAWAASEADLPEALLAHLPLRSMVGVPLVSEDGLDGVLLAGTLDGEPRLRPAPQTMEGLANLARVAALTLRRLRAQTELQRQLAQGKRLNRLIWDFQAAASEAALWENPKGLFARLLNLLAEHVQVEMGVLWTISPKGDRLEFLASAGMEDLDGMEQEGMPLEGPRAGPSAWALQQGEALEILDTLRDPRCTPMLGNFSRMGLRSVLSLPLRGHGGAVLGVLTLFRREPGAVPAQSRAAAHVFASLASLALERARLWERLQTELRNRIESEQRYRILVEESRLGVFLAQHGRILYANPALHAILGRAPGALKGLALAEIFGIQTDGLRGVHIQLPRAQGGPLPLEMHVSDVALDGGPGQLGTVEDITGRYLAQEAMRHAAFQAEALAKATRRFSECVDEESLLQALFCGAGKVAPLRNWWFNARNPEGQLQALLWTPGLEQRFGERPAQALLSIPAPTARVLDRGEGVFFADLRVMDGFPKEVLEVSGLRSFVAVPLQADGRLLGVLSGATFNEEGQADLGEDQLQVLQGLASSAAVALGRLRAQAQLARSEARFRQLFEDAGDAVFLVGPEGVEMANLAAERLLGRSLEHLKGLSPEQLSPECQPDGRNSFHALAQARQKLREGRGVLMEWNFLRPDGTEVPTQVNLSVLRGGESGRVQAIVRDLTSAKQAEGEKQALERQLFQAQKMESLGVLAGGIAHDFNNLLMGVLGHASLALDQLPEDHPLRQNLHAIQRSGEKAADLTRQMLAYSGRGQFMIQRLDLNSQVEEMTHLLRVSLPKSVRMDLALDRAIPMLSADRAQLQQVIMNLVINAAEAIGESTGSIRVATRVETLEAEDMVEMVLGHGAEPGRFVCLEVKDSGCGMDADTQARIFEPFFTTKFTGRGLGLAALAGIVRGHAGVLQVRSVPGVGTEFRVYFPAQGQPLPEEAPAADSLHVQGQGLILVVDDEDIVRAVARQALEARGFEVMEVVDGVDGVAAVKQEGRRIRGVLLDMTMPRMGGEAAYWEIRALAPDLPIILSSGYSEQDTLARFHGASIQGFIQKPYRPNDLLAKVAQALRWPE